MKYSTKSHATLLAAHLLSFCSKKYSTSLNSVFSITESDPIQFNCNLVNGEHDGWMDEFRMDDMDVLLFFCRLAPLLSASSLLEFSISGFRV